jgi:hypothetical protein
VPATAADPPRRRSRVSAGRTGRIARAFVSADDMGHQQLLVTVELDGFDDRLLDPQQGSP